ncbi:MAG: VOC family protein [Pseudonocardiaceae bacterium]
MAHAPQITVWPILHYDDTEAARLSLLNVLGFREAVVARDDHGEIIHAELRWPDGGTVLSGSAKHAESVHGHLRPGTSAMYIPTQDVDEIHQRAQRAGAQILHPPNHTQFGSGAKAYAFTLKDPEGYLWTFGTYTGVTTKHRISTS